MDVIPNHLASLAKQTLLSGSDNYYVWKSNISMFLLALGADWISGKKDSVPAAKVNLDLQILACLYQSLDNTQQRHLVGLVTGLAAYKAIVARFETSTITRRIQARKDFYSVQHNPSCHIDEYIHDVTVARTALTTLGVDVSDTETLDVLLMNLHPDYNTIVTTILAASEEPKLDKVKSILSGASVSFLDIKKEPALANAASSKHGGHHGHSSGHRPHHRSRSRSGGHHGQSSDHRSHDRSRSHSGGRSGSRSGSKADGPPSRHDAKGFRWCDPTNERHCHRCGRAGHIAANCIHDMPQNVKDWVMSNPSRSSAGANAAEEFSDTEEFAGYAFTADDPPGQGVILLT